MADGQESSEEMKAEGQMSPGRRAFEISPLNERHVEGLQERRQRGTEEGFRRITPDEGLKHEKLPKSSQPHGELHRNGERERKPLASENEATNGKVQRLADALTEGHQFQAVQNPDTGIHEVFFAVTRRPVIRPESANEDPHLRWPEPFRINTPSHSSDWETINTTSETSNKENEEPLLITNQEKQRHETVMAQAVRNTMIPLWMATHLNKGKRRASDPPLTSIRVLEDESKVSPTDFISEISLQPNFVIRTGENGPEFYPFSPVSIDYDGGYLRRPRTPSVHSNGSELDCSSPLFLKSYEGAVRGSRDLEKLCWEIPALGPNRSAQLSKQPSSNARVSKWLEGIGTEAKIDSKEAIFSQAEIKTKELTTPPVASPQRAFSVLREDSVWRFPSNSSPSRIPMPSVKALRQISNLRRPGYLAKNSFAVLDPVPDSVQAKRRAPKTRQPVLNTPIKQENPKSDHMVIGTAPRPKDAQFPRPTPPSKLPRKKLPKPFPLSRADEPDTSLFSFEPSKERRDHFAFTLARLEGGISPKTPSPIQRFVHPLGYYGNHVEWERRPARIYRPVPIRPTPLYAIDDEEINFFGPNDEAIGEGRKEPERRSGPAPYLMRRLTERIEEMVLE